MWKIKLQTFIKSLWFHIWLGFPKATIDEINARYNICESCESFNRSKLECGICGCSLSRKKIFLNKLAWADQECPIGKWSKITRK